MVNGPYSAIMQAFTPSDGSDGYWGLNFPGFGGSSNNEGPMTTTLPPTAALAMAFQQGQPGPAQQNYAAAPYYSQTISPMSGASMNALKSGQIKNRFIEKKMHPFLTGPYFINIELLYCFEQY